MATKGCISINRGKLAEIQKVNKSLYSPRGSRGESTPIEILFIGECGSGKSTTINRLLGSEKCKTGNTLHLGGLTTEVEIWTDEWKLRKDDSIDEKSDDFDEQSTSKDNFKRTLDNDPCQHSSQIQENPQTSDHVIVSQKNMNMDRDVNDEETVDILGDTFVANSGTNKQEIDTRESVSNEKENTNKAAGNKEKSKDINGHPKYNNKNSKMENEGFISVNLYDTPVFDKLVTHFKSNKKGFHAIGLVFPLTRYTVERKKFLEQVDSAFGPNLPEFMIIILTKNEDQGEVEDIKEQLKMTGDEVLDNLMKKSGERCILFGRPTETNTFKLEFITKLNDVLSKTKRNCICIKDKKAKKKLTDFLPKCDIL